MEKEAYLFAVLEILRTYSDKDHPLSATTILRILDLRHNITIGVKKFYRAIRTLSSIYQISTYNENRKGYYLKTRQPDKATIFHLCHAIHSTNSLPPKQIRLLEDQLLSLLSIHQKKQYTDSIHLPNPKNAGQENWLPTMDQLSEAIFNRKWIRFGYGHYNIEKKLVARKDPYFREPRFITFDGMHSYLITTDDHHSEPSHFRIDKIINLTILDKKVNNTFNVDDAYKYAATKIFMFAGENIQAKFLCRITPNVFDLLIDEFGKDVVFVPIPDDPGHFILSATSSLHGLLIFAQKYMDLLTPIYPEELVRAVCTRTSVPPTGRNG